jgi:uncharacterized cupin superfamily protein
VNTPQRDDWFVVNAREVQWFDRGPRGFVASFDGDAREFPQYGVNLFVLGPGEPMSMYHWEADQEDFLVLSGEALLIVDGEERPLRAWDFVHTPARVPHTIVGAGEGRCVVLAIGARQNQGGDDWGGYPVEEAAQRHGAGVDEETSSAKEAYARFPQRQPADYGGWLD